MRSVALDLHSSGVRRPRVLLGKQGSDVITISYTSSGTTNTKYVKGQRFGFLNKDYVIIASAVMLGIACARVRRAPLHAAGASACAPRKARL